MARLVVSNVQEGGKTIIHVCDLASEAIHEQLSNYRRPESGS